MSTAAPAITAEFAVTFREMTLSGLAAEMQTTKKVIASIPENSLNFRLEPKARTCRELAWHIIHDDVTFLNMIADMQVGMPEEKAPPDTIREMLNYYDREFPEAIARVQALTPEQLVTVIDCFGMKMPVFAILPIVNNHSIHHRGQLSAMLRPAGGKVPSIYGGSADEPWQG